jgi:hypothetical protein
MAHDAELDALAAKIKQLTLDRDVALRIAERAIASANQARTDAETYRHLWDDAAAQLERYRLAQSQYVKGSLNHGWLWVVLAVASIVGIGLFCTGI